MVIPCIRCGKEINSPDSTNADYVTAEDMVVREQRDNYMEVDKTSEELATEEANLRSELRRCEEIIRVYELTNINTQQIPIEDIQGEIEAIEERLKIGLEKTKLVFQGWEMVDIQKTGIICPDCYRPTDFVIWGVHK